MSINETSHEETFVTQEHDYPGKFHVLETFPLSRESREQRVKDSCLRGNALHELQKLKPEKMNT